MFKLHRVLCPVDFSEPSRRALRYASTIARWHESELVVLVTPYVVEPAAKQDFAQPDQGFGWASDVQTDLLGQMNRIYGRNPERAPVGKFDGDVGYIVEQ